ncbi:protein adenylyltransferase SelO [Alteromonas antoniana]|uniref:protein adenylyltransferase SelO n=1 Tax=Alteromonas antoniana TaxID=2803813 RepID=UPI001C497AC9
MTLARRYADALPDLVSQVVPQPLQGMRLRLVNHELADALSLPQSWWQQNELLAALQDQNSALSQNAVAQKYGGHQFGHWNPFLGDGRGLLLGEAKHAVHGWQDLHLKGAGQTPYSRHADGRAVLRSTLREYLGQEALHHLGIPTSRSLCLFSSTDTVYREQPEPGAMMIRTAPSHIRFGHFEYYFNTQNSDALAKLVTFALNEHFPECLQAENPWAAMLLAITLRTARLVAHWQVHGFVHGVMNTDNMSVHGITFDYGPYAFMDTFTSSAVFNHSDHEGRYAFDRQPGIALWNLNALAHAFSDQCSIEELRDALSRFEPVFLDQYHRLMTARMGLDTDDTGIKLMQDWLSMLETQQRDYTDSFRLLALADLTLSSSPLRDHFPDRDNFDAWWQSYRNYRLHGETASIPQASLLSKNPAVIPRTHQLTELISEAEAGDWSTVEQFLGALTSPFDTRWDNHPFSRPPANPTSVSLSCSS